MKLKTKILLGYSVTLALVVLVSGWGILNLRRLGKASNAIVQENYRSIQAAANMIDAVEKQDEAIWLWLLNKEKQSKDQFYQNEIIFLQSLDLAKNNITISGEEQILFNLEESYKKYLIVSQELKKISTDRPSVITQRYYESILPELEKVRQTCIQLRELNQQTMLAASLQAEAVSQQAVWSMAIAGILAAGSGLAFCLILSDFLVRPLKKMIIATTRIAEGDYNVDIAVKSRDELGLLAEEIIILCEKLQAFHELNVGKVIAEKQRSEAILQSISDGILVVDADFKIVAINLSAANIFNTNPQVASGKHFLEVVNHPELYQNIKATAKTGKPSILLEDRSILSLEKSKQTQYYKLAITPVMTDKGTMLGVILLLQDVTKLKELDRLKSEFVATASHELRTPLTGMSMSLNLLLETTESKLSEREKELLQAAAEDVQRLGNLVNDLLDLSKIESGRIEMEFTAVKLEFLFKKAVSSLQLQAQEKKVNLIYPDSSSLPLVKADPNKIIWVLTNLIANALRYTDAGGEIRLEGDRLGEWMYVSVSDNGAGIPKEYQSKIFDKYVQVNTDKDTGGSGLGLAICKEVIKAHGGRIWVDSTLNSGSKFTFTLPVTSNE